MDNRVNIAVVVGVIFVLAFAVTLTQSDKQVESQVNEDEIPEELIYEWLKKYDPSEQTISVSGTATASSNPDTLIIVLGVESVAKTANESLSENSNSLNHATKTRPKSEHSWHQLCILSDNPSELISNLDSMGVDARVHYPIPCNRHQVYSNHIQHNSTLPICEDIAHRLVAIPVHPSITQNDIERINSALNL